MPFYDFEGQNLFYQRCGTGEPVLLFLHGLFGNSGNWKYQVEFFEKKYEVITVDLFGHGQSSGDIDPVMAPRRSAEAIDSLMRNRIGRPYLAIGHSYAGFVLPEMIKLGDPHLEGAVFVDCTYPGNEYTIEAREKFGAHMLSLADDILTNESLYWYDTLIGPTIEPEAKRLILESFRSSDARWMFQSSGGCRKFVENCPPDKTPTPDTLPVFIMEAGHGIGENFARSWINHFRMARYYLFEKAYHFFYIAEHEKFNVLLNDFIDRRE